MFGRPTGSRVLIIEDEGGKAGALSEQGTLTDLLNDPTAFLIGTALHPYTKELLEFSKHREISYFYLPPLSPSFLLASLTAANGQIKPEYLQHNLVRAVFCLASSNTRVPRVSISTRDWVSKCFAQPDQ
mmetsp:Transcript_20033/g.44771  ORF Transcript_20033/g.44771 Transcript_20033/m.44771 type:complete len:129 (+) Transcript_20033:209-595(+)